MLVLAGPHRVSTAGAGLPALMRLADAAVVALCSGEGEAAATPAALMGEKLVVGTRAPPVLGLPAGDGDTWYAPFVESEGLDVIDMRPAAGAPPGDEPGKDGRRIVVVSSGCGCPIRPV